jgi:hypothetical protein
MTTTTAIAAITDRMEPPRRRQAGPMGCNGL